MALPNLSNDRPIYEMTIPSTKETIKYRPFLVKEQKALLIAYESKDTKQILNSMLSCIETCVPGTNIKNLATFDVDYMFLKVRSKSVGESTKLLSACAECNEENEITINIEDVKMEAAEIKNQVIPINDDVSVEMKYPTYADVISKSVGIDEEISGAEEVFNSITSCLNAVQTKEENILISQEPKEEVDKFINSLTNTQLEKMSKFVENMPTLMHAHEYTCKKCNHNNTVELKGLQDFF